MRSPPNLPFLAGPPDFTVGLRPIEEARWLTPDWEAAALPEKDALLKSDHPPVRALAGSQAAQAEAATLIATALGAPAPADLAGAAALVSDDLVLLQRAPDAWRATALALCSPTFFSAEEAIGGTLAALHGPVPEASLAARITRVFDALRPDLVLERFNWTVQAGAARFTPQAPPQGAGPLHLRVERQTIRRLPETRAVLFTIRISLDPLAAVFVDAAVREAFAQAWADAPAAVRAYKRWAQHEAAVAALLGAFQERI